MYFEIAVTPYEYLRFDSIVFTYSNNALNASNTSKPKHGIDDKLSDKERHLEGRMFQLSTLVKCREFVAKTLDSQTLDCYDQEIACRASSIEAIQERRLWTLLKSIFRKSKMKNLQVELGNLAIALRE